MALLQISEPGMSTDPHQHRVAIGIDLGTTFSLVAAVRHGFPEVLSDKNGRTSLPSIVTYHQNKKVCVGLTEDNIQQESTPHSVINSAKRLIGRKLADINTNIIGYELIDDPDMVKINTVQGTISPVDVSARILKTLYAQAQEALNDDIIGAVITVPAYFDDAQRQATKDAANLAGINVLRLLNEPTAAAIAYGLDQHAQGIFAIYDLGGGTFDISILKLEEGIFKVIATGGDTQLGGDDFDATIVEWMNQQLGEHTKHLSQAQKLHLARQAKEALTQSQETQIIVQTSESTITLTLTRAQFETLVAPLIERTLNATRHTIDDSQLKLNQIDAIVCVGGSTRMPCIQHALHQYFGKPPKTDINPDQVVALGAALQANLLAGNQINEDWLLLDVIPLSLGLETMGGLVEKIIPRNATLPIAKAQEFTTYKDGQTAMSIHVVQGERELVSDCRSLARFELRGIPPMVAGQARIRVTYQVNADGILSVAAEELTTHTQATITVKPSYGLSDEDIAKMLSESFQTAKEDMQARALREAQVEAQRLEYALHQALEKDSDLLNPQELSELKQQLAQLHELAQNSDADAITAASEALNTASEEFAAKRMDRSIQAALTGQRLNNL